MLYSEFNDLASGIQASVVAAAAIIGGLWAGFRFLSFRELDAKRTELESGKAALEKARRELLQTGTLNWTMTCEPLRDPVSEQWYLMLRIGVANVGNRPEVLDWTSATVNVNRVSGCSGGLSGADGDFILCMPMCGPAALEQSTVGPGSQGEYVCLAPIAGPGLYRAWMAMFTTPEEAADALAQLGRVGVDDGPIIWHIDAYCLVQEPLPAGIEEASNKGIERTAPGSIDQ